MYDCNYGTFFRSKQVCMTIIVIHTCLLLKNVPYPYVYKNKSTFRCRDRRPVSAVSDKSQGHINFRS